MQAAPASKEATDFVPEVPVNFNLGTMGGFYKYQEFIDEIDAMAAQYPNLITVKDTINNYLSIENRPIYFMRMSDNAATDENEPEILYTSIHHAREPNSLSEVIFYMWYLLENYDNSEEIQFLLDNTELYFVPMINPDGYIYNEVNDPNGGGMWRKNRRNNGWKLWCRFKSKLFLSVGNKRHQHDTFGRYVSGNGCIYRT